jgi:hypothetical protein
MRTLYGIDYVIHVLASCLGLLAMLPPLLARKGGRIHTRAGAVFVYAMATSALTGALLAAAWVSAPATFRPSETPAAARLSGLFLMLIGALTGNAVVQGQLAIARKRAPGPQVSLRSLGTIVLLIAVGLTALVVGGGRGHVLSLIFGPLALLVSVGDLAFALRPLPHPRAYLYQHIRAMGTACISAVTAFTVLGARRLFGGDIFAGNAWISWVLPGVLLGPVFVRWLRIYQRKFEGTRRLAARPAGHAREPA